MRRQLIFFTILAFSCFIAIARDLTTLIIDSVSNEPIPYANLVYNSDGFKTTAISGEDGAVSVSVPDSISSATIAVVAFGYTTLNLSEPIDPVIKLTPEANTLQEVEVKATKEYVKSQPNGFKIAIKDSPLSNLSSSMLMMKQLPLIDGMSGGIAVLGKRNTQVYINKRHITDLSELERYSPSQIESVEINLQPGLKYGRDVDAVVIIHLLNTAPGFSGKLVASYRQNGDMAGGDGNVKLNYGFANGWTISADANLSDIGNPYGNNNSDAVAGVYETELSGDYKTRAKKIGASASIFRNLKNSSYGIQYRFTRTPSSIADETSSYISDF